MKKLINILLLIIVPFNCFSQNEANNWFFGGNAGLSFNNNTIAPIINGQLSTAEGCASISDSDGNLLFYTDGITVYNAEHSVMSNGNELNGNYSSTHSAIIVPRPNHENIYYIFTVDHLGLAKGLQYSEVNMDADFGLGVVTDNKNIQLYSSVEEKVTAIKHASLNEYWVVSHAYGSNEFLTYRVSENGVDPNPIISAVGSTVPVTSDRFNSSGQMKISSDGSKLAVARTNFPNEVQVLDFNASTGQLSNPTTIIYYGDGRHPYGIEFSPNNKLLYVNTHLGVYQYNLSDIRPEGLLVSTVTGLGALQLAPNGKIYLAEWESSFLHGINSPDDLGDDCEFQENVIYLGGKMSFLGLPTFIQSFLVVGFQVDNVCVDSYANFIANINQPYDSILWDFGDGNISTEENPSHMYNVAGDYEVELTVTNGVETSTEIKTITVFEQPSIVSPVELKQCDDDLDGFSPFNLDEVISEITNNSQNETITFHKSLFDAENDHDAIFNTTNFINTSISSDIIWARIENYNGCYVTSQVNLYVTTAQIPNTFLREFYQCDDGGDPFDGIATFDFSSVVSEIEELFPINQELIINFYNNPSDALTESNPIIDISNYQNISSPTIQRIYVRVDNAINNDCLSLGQYVNLYTITLPQISLYEEIVICEDGYVTLSADSGGNYYNWSTGENTRIITVDEPGQYIVAISNDFNDLICSVDKTITVLSSNIPSSIEIETLDWTQNNNEISISVQGSGSYEYSIDGFNYQESSIFTGLLPKEYTIFIRDKNGCGVISENVYLMNYPRFFTPNGDGHNEVWQIINSTNELLNKLYIYDRYGKLIKQLKPDDLGWDGTCNGNKMPSGGYWFVLERQDGRNYTGHFTLKR